MHMCCLPCLLKVYLYYCYLGRRAAAADTVADGEQYSQGQQQNVGKIHKHLYCGAGAMVRGANYETFFFFRCTHEI